MVEEKIAVKSVQTEMEQLKTGQTYKVIHGQFAKRIDAITAATTVKEKGFYVRIVVEKGNYKLIYTEENSKASAEVALKIIKAAGLNAEIRENNKI